MHIEISKYNPELRDENGHYNFDTWLDISDIGKYPDLQTYEEYKVWEKKYWETIESILRNLGIKHLEITCFEAWAREQSEFSSRRVLEDSELKEALSNIYKAYNFSYKRLLNVLGYGLFRINGKYRIGRSFQRVSRQKKTVTLKEAEQLFYLSLRDAIFVELSGEKGVCIRALSDFYSYLEADVDFTWDKVSGIYIRPASPYRSEEDEEEYKRNFKEGIFRW